MKVNELTAEQRTADWQAAAQFVYELETTGKVSSTALSDAGAALSRYAMILGHRRAGKGRRGQSRLQYATFMCVAAGEADGMSRDAAIECICGEDEVAINTVHEWYQRGRYSTQRESAEAAIQGADDSLSRWFRLSCHAENINTEKNSGRITAPEAEAVDARITPMLEALSLRSI